MKFAQFTTPNGAAVYIAPAWVVSIRDSMMRVENGNCCIKLSGGEQFVQETPAVVRKLLEEAS